MLQLNSRHLLLALLFGLLGGGLIGVYFQTLNRLAAIQGLNPGLVLLIPLLYLLHILIKRNSSFIPTSMLEVRSATERDTVLWSRLTLPYNFLMSIASHVVGGSIGRESTAVVLSTAGLIYTRFNWGYWMPVLVSSGFGMATGSLLVAFVVCVELFFTKAEQKFYVIIATWTGKLVLATLQIPPLFEDNLKDANNNGFFSGLITIFAIGLVAGYSARFYKAGLVWLKNQFQNFRNAWKIILGFATALALTAAYIQLPLTDYKSLGLIHVPQILNGDVTWYFPLVKALLTLGFVALGFVGGEFIPSVIIGASMGVGLATALGENSQFGFVIGAFCFFAGLSRLKWTALALTFVYFGFFNTIWALFAISIADSYSGEKRLF